MLEDKHQCTIARFYWIDALRGIAALTIVIFHYHHFYLADAYDRPALPPIETFPYAGLLLPLYSSFAAHAVELFWFISGFVFAHVYLPRRVTAWNFAVIRFARLYPLHLATLLYVATLQALSLHQTGHWQIYANNDVRHFVLQVFMSSNWITWARGLSFNGPIWSVSVELVVYALFFLSLFVLRHAPTMIALFLGASAWAFFTYGPSRLPLVQLGVFYCAGYFFFGCLLYALKPHATGLRCVVFIGLGLSIAAGGIITGTDRFAILGSAVLLVSLAAHLDRVVPAYGRHLSPLGDISYSLYLVHVPLQMTVLLVADLAFEGTRSFAQNHLTLPVYTSVSIVTALAVTRGFEHPAGQALRRTLLQR